MKSFFFASLSATLISVSTIHADILAAWDVNGVNMSSNNNSGLDISPPTDPYTLSATIKASNIGISEMTLGSSNPLENGSPNSYGFEVPVASQTTSLQGAIDNNNYLQFTISAAANFNLDLDTIQFAQLRSGASGPNDYALMASVDGGLTGFTNGSELHTATGVRGTDFFTSALSVSQLGAPTNVTFRLYAWNTLPGASSKTRTQINHISGNDLTINGFSSSAVPEVQSVLPLASLLGFAIISLRRRKQR